MDSWTLGRNIFFLSFSKIFENNTILIFRSTGGVTKSISDSIVAIIIPEGAHHLDLRAADPNDPPSVVKAREIEKQFITKWVSSVKAKKEMVKPIIVV